MKTVLVVVFLLGPHHGDGWNSSVLRRDMKSEQRCQEKLAEVKAKSPKLQAHCATKKEAYNGKS